MLVSQIPEVQDPRSGIANASEAAAAASMSMVDWLSPSRFATTTASDLGLVQVRPWSVPLAAFGRQSAVEKSAVRARLFATSVNPKFHEEILDALPARAFGVVLYGSVARGDTSSASDIDLLVVADGHEKTRAIGRVNVTSYDQDQFRSAAGTLYGMHIARDGVLLHDSGGIHETILDFGDVDILRVEKRLSQLAVLLEFPDDELKIHLQGFTRHARYVLRTATYLAAIKAGKPCFSVSELAEQSGDPSLVHLLSSHPEVQGDPTWQNFLELRRRLRERIRPDDKIEYDSLNDAVVGFARTSPDISDAAILILNRKSSDPYSVIPRVIL